MVSCIAPSRHEPGTAYVTFDKHQAADSYPYVYKVTDYGANWKLLTPCHECDDHRIDCNGIPYSVVSYVHWICEDPVCAGLLYCGTENALYISYDDGGCWQVLPGLPPTPVSGIVVQEHFHDLVLSTFGRGFWIYDDITPIRQLADVGEAPVYLFKMPRPMYRFHSESVATPMSIPPDNDPTTGSDPTSPAPINFYLSAPAEKVKITILDVFFELTKQSLDNLVRDEVPDSILEKLNSLINQVFESEDKFLEAIEHEIGEDQTFSAKDLILKHARHTDNPKGDIRSALSLHERVIRAKEDLSKGKVYKPKWMQQ